MLKYKCLVLDHDDTVMQSEKTLCYPCFAITMARLRPDVTVTLEDYIRDCYTMGFYEMCTAKYGFSQEEMQEEYDDWKAYLQTHSADPFEGIASIICKYKELGGIVCVVSHSSEKIIRRDYASHIGVMPDAIYGADFPLEQQKPNVFPLRSIMDAYSLSPADLFVLDDSKIGYDMALAAGVKIGFAAWSKEDYPEMLVQMSRLCDHTFHTVTQFEEFLLS